MSLRFHRMNVYPPEESAGGGGSQGPAGPAGADGATGPAGADGIDAAPKDYCSFKNTTGGITGIANTAVTLALGLIGVNSGIGAVLLNVVTITKTADFAITADIYINNSSTSRSEYSVWIEVNSGVSWSEVSGSRAAIYARGYDSGQSASINLQLAVTTGDQFRLRAQRTDGGSTAGYQDANGTRLNFQELG